MFRSSEIQILTGESETVTLTLTNAALLPETAEVTVELKPVGRSHIDGGADVVAL